MFHPSQRGADCQPLPQWYVGHGSEAALQTVRNEWLGQNIFDALGVAQEQTTRRHNQGRIKVPLPDVYDVLKDPNVAQNKIV